MNNHYICWAEPDGTITGQRFNNGYYNQNAPQEILGVTKSKYDALLAEFKELEDQANDYYDVLVNTYKHEFPKSQDEVNAEQTKIIAECKTQLETATATMAAQTKLIAEQASINAANSKAMADILAEIKALRAAASQQTPNKAKVKNESA